jgi:hypothetical protein
MAAKATAARLPWLRTGLILDLKLLLMSNDRNSWRNDGRATPSCLRSTRHSDVLQAPIESKQRPNSSRLLES